MNELFTRYGLLCALALLAVLIIAGLWYRRHRIGYDTWIRLVVLAVPLAWLCSRAAYCLTSLSYYLFTVENPALILRFRDGGYSLFGALGGLILAAGLTARWQHVSFAVLLDGIGLAAPVGIIIERLAQSGTGIGWGRDIKSDWLQPIGVTENLWHPVYLYQAVVTAILLLALLLWLKSRRGALINGDLALVFATLYGCAEVVLESLCKDGHMMVRDNLVHINQIIAIVLPVAALLVWSLRLKKQGTQKSQRIAGWLVVAWLIVVACIGIGINQEFAVDRKNNLYLEYGIMIAAMVVVAATALTIRRKANS